MQFVREAVRVAESNGFRKWDPKAAGLKPGTRWYAVNRDRTIVLFVVGSEPMENGLRIVNTHIDSPRIEFKTKPFREKAGVGLFPFVACLGVDRKSTRLNSSHLARSRMPSSA